MDELLHPETSALNARDAGKFLVEAARRLSSPLSAASYAMVALLSVLTGTFRRHGNVMRPLTAVLCVVALLALQLAVANLAARSTALLPLIWIVAAGPGLVAAWILYWPQIRRLGAWPPGSPPSMTIAATLSLYVGRQFSIALLAMLAALSGLVSLFDFIELLRRSATKPSATFGIVMQIAALRLPYIAMQILPFAVLLGGIIAFWRLTRSSELIVARAAGVSAWQFLAAPVACALLTGTVATAIISPLSSVMLARAETLDNIYLRTGGGPLALSGGQLWLRQADHGLDPAGVAILHAQGVSMTHGRLTANEVSVFRLSADDRELLRVEAKKRHAGERRLAVGGRSDDVARPPAGGCRHDAPADRPDRGAVCRRASLRLTRCRYGRCRTSSGC